MPWCEHTHTCSQINKYTNKCKSKDSFFLIEVNNQEMGYNVIVLVWGYFTEVSQRSQLKAMKQNKSSDWISGPLNCCFSEF